MSGHASATRAGRPSWPRPYLALAEADYRSGPVVAYVGRADAPPEQEGTLVAPNLAVLWAAPGLPGTR
jgi:hypothetical protein